MKRTMVFTNTAASCQVSHLPSRVPCSRRMRNIRRLVRFSHPGFSAVVDDVTLAEDGSFYEALGYLIAMVLGEAPAMGTDSMLEVRRESRLCHSHDPQGVSLTSRRQNVDARRTLQVCSLFLRPPPDRWP